MSEQKKPSRVQPVQQPAVGPSTAWGYIGAGAVVMLAGGMFLAVDGFEWMGFVILAIGGIVTQVGVIAAGVRLGIQSAGR